jgi:hypothetical protein
VNDDCIAILYVKSGRIFEHDLFVDGFIGIRNVDHFPLQCVVQLLGAGKKGRSSLIMRHPAAMPMALNNNVSGVRISVTPPP